MFTRGYGWAPCQNPPAADERCGNVAHRCAQSHRALSAPAHSDRSQFGHIETVSWIQQFKDVECNIERTHRTDMAKIIKTGRLDVDSTIFPHFSHIFIQLFDEKSQDPQDPQDPQRLEQPETLSAKAQRDSHQGPQPRLNQEIESMICKSMCIYIYTL